MITVDARALREPHPTGVTEVARQFIGHITKQFPDARLFTGEKNFSNTLTNLALMSRLTTLEAQSGVDNNNREIIFLPNTHFVHNKPTAIRIQVVHDLSFFHSPQWFSPRMRLWHAAARARREIETSDILVAVSEWTRRDLIDYLHIPAELVHVVHPTTPVPQGGERPPTLPFKHKPFFLFLGTLEKRKNVRGVVEAFEMIKNLPALKDFQLVLAGRAGFGAPKHFPDRVHHLSYITAAEKWWLLKHATALVYPSFFEGFGLPPLEAAAAGCPTIISDCTAPPETMGKAAIQVSPYDISQIALAMEALAVDKKLAAFYRQRGFERALWYSSDKQRTALRDVFAHAQKLI